MNNFNLRKYLAEGFLRKSKTPQKSQIYNIDKYIKKVRPSIDSANALQWELQELNYYVWEQGEGKFPKDYKKIYLTEKYLDELIEFLENLPKSK